MVCQWGNNNIIGDALLCSSIVVKYDRHTETGRKRTTTDAT